MKTTIAAIAALLATSLALAEPPSETARAEMAKLSPLIGKWKGSGWMAMPGSRSEFASEETVEARLDGRALLIEGFHKDGSGAVVHHALGLLAWDDTAREYRMQTAVATGRTGNYPGKVENGKFTWTMSPPAGGTMRYVIILDAERWVETGEYSRDGVKWNRFFEMKLDKVK